MLRSIAAFPFVVAFAGTLCASGASGQMPEPLPLQLETKIPLGSVVGRIDHMAIDLVRHHAFVAELGNNTVAVVDLDRRKVIHRFSGLKEPQGVAYVASSDMLYVANAGDGSVRFFNGNDFATAGEIELGSDADNIRVNTATNRVFIGFGGGALAVIDAATHSKIGDIPLKAHPEGFQLDPDTSRIFVNVPSAQAIQVVDGVSRKLIASWPMMGLGANFPMALDNAKRHVVVAFRRPAKLGIFSIADGSLTASAAVCGDADDVFIDAKRKRAYISCGDGFVDVFDTQGLPYRRIGHIQTVSGARTALFVPELDRLLVAARASSGEQAAIWVFRPAP